MTATFKNHLNSNVFLEEPTFLKLIEEDPTRNNILEHLSDVIKDPDEIWINEYEKDPEIIVYKYIKFYSSLAIFAIADISNPFEQKLIDFYLINSGEYVDIDGNRTNKIDIEREGILKKSKVNT